MTCSLLVLIKLPQPNEMATSMLPYQQTNLLQAESAVALADGTRRNS